MNVLAASGTQAVTVDARIVPQQGSVNCQWWQVRVFNTEPSPSGGGQLWKRSLLSASTICKISSIEAPCARIGALSVIVLRPAVPDLSNMMPCRLAPCMSQQITKGFANLSLAFGARHLSVPRSGPAVPVEGRVPANGHEPLVHCPAPRRGRQTAHTLRR